MVQTLDLQAYFRDYISYEKFCFVIDEANISPSKNDLTRAPLVVEAIFKIVTQTPISVLKEMYQNLLKYRDQLLWRSKNSQVIDNILIEAEKARNGTLCRF